MDKVKYWLKEKLSYGPLLASDVIKEAKDIGFNTSGSNSLLYKAKEQLNIQSIEGFNKEWWWIDTSVQMSPELKKAWLTDNKKWIEKNIKDLDYFYDDENNKFVEDDEVVYPSIPIEAQNPYEWIHNNGIYYYDYSPDQAIDVKMSEERIETSKKLKEVRDSRREKEKEAHEHKKAYKEIYNESFY